MALAPQKTLAMTDADRDRVSAAVSGAEATSAGEIVTIHAAASDDYHDIALIWSFAIGLLALVALTLAPNFFLNLLDRISGNWTQQWTPRELFGIAAVVVSIKALTIWLLQLWRPLRLALVPASVKHARVRTRAVTCFKIGAERRTTGRTGILIYLSEAEHRAEIVADEAIASLVPAEVWGDAMAALLAELKRGRMADGLVAAIGQVGIILAAHFPHADDDRNELPDRMIEV